MDLDAQKDILEVHAGTVVTLDGATVVVVMSEQSGSSFRSLAFEAENVYNQGKFQMTY